MSAADAKLSVTVLGSGTSQGVPMIGCTCEVCRSTDPRDKRTRSSIYLATPTAKIMVDTTPDMRQQALRENLDHLDAVLFTHPHADHLMGFDDLRRFCELQGGRCRSMARRKPWRRSSGFSFTRSIPRRSCPATCMSSHMWSRGRSNSADSRSRPLPVPHGAISTNGFLFAHGGRRLLAYLSDCAEVPEPIRQRIAGVDVLIIDGLREKPHPTHLNVAGAIEACQAIGARQSYLTHQTHERFHVDRERQLPPGIGVTYDGMKLEFGLT